MKFKESEEKNFLKTLQNKKYIHGIIGRKWWNPDTQEYFGEQKYIVADSNLKILFEHEAFGKGGNFHENVYEKMKEFNLDKNELYQDDSLDDLISNQITKSSINWSSEFWEGETLETFRTSKDGFDIEKSSNEFENLSEICDHMNNRIIAYSESRLDKNDIEYHFFTEIGQRKIDECIEWYKNNKSITPIQDAWHKLLVSKGINVDWKPHLVKDVSVLPIMKGIDYSTKEELDAKREKRIREIYTPEVKSKLKELLKRIKI